MAGAEWKRLGARIVRRRVELGMKTTKALADQTGLTPRMLGDIENGRRTNYSPGTIAQIEIALRWVAGSVHTVLAGGDPITDGPKAGGAIATEPEPSAESPDETGFETLVLVAETLMTMPQLTADEHQRMTEAIHDARRGTELLRPMLHVPEVQLAYSKNVRQLASLVTEFGQLLTARSPQDGRCAAAEAEANVTERPAAHSPKPLSSTRKTGERG
jgi:transcriptional regulator with XRE-family HTH domain